jgi:hypothetical protein
MLAVAQRDLQKKMRKTKEIRFLSHFISYRGPLEKMFWDENGDLLADSHNILNRWKNYFSLNRWKNYFGLIEVHNG